MIIRRSIFDNRFINIGINQIVNGTDTCIFFNFFFNSVFRLFQFLELIDKIQNNRGIDVLLMKRELRKDAKLMNLLQ